MEAGRAILRGFVTPDRTTLIASTHRALAVLEKMVPGDGIASAEEVLAAADIAARAVLKADFETLAVENGSVISASLFGALAASADRPFPREAFEAAIKPGRPWGRGVAEGLCCRLRRRGRPAPRPPARPEAPAPPPRPVAPQG